MTSSVTRTAVCNFELEVEKFLGQPEQQQLVFAPNLTPYQVCCCFHLWPALTTYAPLDPVNE